MNMDEHELGRFLRLLPPAPAEWTQAAQELPFLTAELSDEDLSIDFAQHTLTARGLNANLKERTIRLESKVNGRFHP